MKHNFFGVIFPSDLFSPHSALSIPEVEKTPVTLFIIFLYLLGCQTGIKMDLVGGLVLGFFLGAVFCKAYPAAKN